MTIDYDKASQTYDNTRRGDQNLLDQFATRVALTEESRVLDFGCGTGNYLVQIRERFGCACYGVEPSAGMRAAAAEKDDSLILAEGDHQNIPFESGSFDFIYMTDVIHHVPEMGQMFTELARVLAPNGQICVVTESHPQITARFYNRYFPSLVGVETGRYPAIASIIAAAATGGLHFQGRETIPQKERVVDDTFITNVREKNYSMFRLLSDTEFSTGLAALEADADRRFPPGAAGQTLVWLARG
ncbi:MAG: class I SAM-dependent methyltransferase [Anaerolineales bacterium]|nr:class I SAM-dependent methyltransferase [Anaerolineales bacterium]MCB0007754.1 class I SAM-dependent methyltransferase [Anaerolineales bacterium]MCB0018910.1 class I SAM-dependent methyltransferase [Anaerolineales bacterium]MCB8960505.1 class I SAM-dependent methyltransferase [Ardenticatenales bacterium]